MNRSATTGHGAMRSRTFALIAILALGASGCGDEGSSAVGGVKNRVAATPSCPSFAEVEEMESEELNKIPLECDENVPVPSEEPGVSSENWVDPDGDSTIGVRHFVTAPFQADGRLAAADDQDFIGLKWAGGSVLVRLTGLTSDLDLFITDERGDMKGLSTKAGTTDEQARVTLSAGRYYVVVQPKDEHQDPKAPYHLAIDRAPAA